jgi:hypothetical protein
MTDGGIRTEVLQRLKRRWRLACAAVWMLNNGSDIGPA